MFGEDKRPDKNIINKKKTERESEVVAYKNKAHRKPATSMSDRSKQRRVGRKSVCQ